jgi:hypothetical protein
MSEDSSDSTVRAARSGGQDVRAPLNLAEFSPSKPIFDIAGVKS